MKRNKTIYNIIYILVFLLISGYGLINSLGIVKGTFHPPIFYTSLSCLLCFSYFFIAFINVIIRFLKKKQVTQNTFFLFPRFKGALTMCITVTFLVYHFFVYEGPKYTVDFSLQNLIMHYIVPVMVILHWLIFDKKGIYDKFDPVFWTIIPLSYFGWANIYAKMHTTPQWDGEWYPYGFMDLTKHSSGQVSVTIIFLVIFFIILGYIIVGIDNALAKKEQNLYK